MSEYLETRNNPTRGHEDQRGQQNYDSLVTLVRKLINEKYYDEMEAITVEIHVQDIAQRVTAYVKTLGQDQYRRVRSGAVERGQASLPSHRPEK